ncbi:MAG: DNA internalization-related competence protein ComEC/Rec2 [Clostridiales bacterium]|nr:DNA internalization-related competence protein ComEC/Rec2 [Clostridiales bacterium]
MKRSATLFAVIGYLLIITILKELIVLSVMIFIVGFYWTQEHYRKLYIILMLLIILSVLSFASDYSDYDALESHMITSGLIKSYGVDYQLIIDKQTKVLIKKEGEIEIEQGYYHVEYEKNAFFYQNPNTFNYKNYLHSKGFSDVVKQTEISYKLIKSMKRFNNTFFDSFISRLSQTKHYAYYKGILFNDKSNIDKEVLEMFQDNGSSHVLAISGLHIGLIFGFFYSVLKVFNKRFRRLAACFFVVMYVLAINMPISSVRALLMILLSVAAIYQNRKYDLLQTLGFIGYSLMLFNPYIIYHTGFQYSFVAVLIIEVCYQSFFRSINSYFMQLLLLSVVIQIGMMPLVSYHNNQIHLLSFIANIPTVLLIGVVLNGLLLSFMIPSMTLLHWIDFVFDVILSINRWVYGLDRFILELPSPPFAIVVLLYMLLFLFREKKHRKYLLVTAVSVILCWCAYFSLVIEVYFLDIGQGDCILIKRGFTTILIDGGLETDTDHLRGVLYKQGITSIDYLIVSHSHSDHIGGLLDIKDMTRECQLFYKTPNELEPAFNSLSYKEKIAIDRLSSYNLKWLSFDFIHYPSFNELNNASLVAYVTLYESTLLLTGDIESDVEDMIIDQLYEVDILKVPHHGSKTSSTEMFVQNVSPEVAVICVGKNNYGHPHQEIVDRYEQTDSSVFKTQNGCVKVYIFPFDNYFVKAFN